MNLSNVESVQFQTFSAPLFDSNAYKVGHGIGITSCLIAGSIFYGGTIAYERYGGDPMKRSPVLDSLKLARRESALLHRLVAPNLFTIFVSHDF